MTKGETVTLIQTLIVMYPRTEIKADELTIGVWHEMLRDLPADAVMLAVKRMGATLKYPPSIADIRENVAQAADTSEPAHAAWAKVVKAIHWYGSYRAEDARAKLGDEVWRVIESCGGWKEMCTSETAEEIRSAQFIKRYESEHAFNAELIQIPQDVRDGMKALTAPLVEKLRLNGGASE